MKRVVSTSVQPDQYQADACLVWCSDNRFSKLLIGFSNQKVDLIKVHGGAANLMGTEEEKQFVLNQIRSSLQRSDPPVVALMIHMGCGVYGERKIPMREGAYEAEQEFYFDQLRAIKDIVQEFLKEEGLETEVTTYLGDFDGLIKV